MSRQVRRLQREFPVLRDRPGLHEDAGGRLTHTARGLAKGELELRQPGFVETLEQVIGGEDPGLTKSQGHLLLDIGHNGNVVAVDGGIPAVLRETTGSALGPLHSSLRLLRTRLQHSNSTQHAAQPLRIPRLQTDDLSCPAVHFKALQRRGARSLKEVPVELELQHDLRVILLRDATRDLRVANHVAVVSPHQEVGGADEVETAQLSDQQALIDDRLARRQRRGRSSSALRNRALGSVSYTHLRAHETDSYLVCRLLLE